MEKKWTAISYGLLNTQHAIIDFSVLYEMHIYSFILISSFILVSGCVGIVLSALLFPGVDDTV